MFDVVMRSLPPGLGGPAFDAGLPCQSFFDTSDYLGRPPTGAGKGTAATPLAQGTDASRSRERRCQERSCRNGTAQADAHVGSSRVPSRFRLIKSEREIAGNFLESRGFQG